MPEEIEIETKDLQETLQELQEERKDRAAEEREGAWIRYVALTTALLAVFAAIGALQSGALVNEAMMLQLKSSDKWNEYEADRQKEHVYTIQSYLLLDHGARLVEGAKGQHHSDTNVTSVARTAADKPAEATTKAADPGWRPLTPDQRLAVFVARAEKEHDKEQDLSAEAAKLSRESEHTMHLHHMFATAVTLIQVAVALAAVSALSKIKTVWLFSLLVGLAGLVMFVLGFLPP